MRNKELRVFLLDRFDEFNRIHLRHIYGIGDPINYDNKQKAVSDLEAVNPFIHTEADIQVKFGGFLESQLLIMGTGLTVHAELPIYKESPDPTSVKNRADISIHSIKRGELWTRKKMLESLRAVVEIKYANYGSPAYNFTKGGTNDVCSDLRKMINMNCENMVKVLLLIDEGSILFTPGSKRKNKQKEHGKIREAIDLIRSHGILLLTNNENLRDAIEN